MIEILLITNKKDVTTDFIIKNLRERNLNFYRFNTEDLSSKISINFDFSLNSFILYDGEIEIDLLKIKSVYYRRPLIPDLEANNLSIGEYNFAKAEITYTLEGFYKILQNAFWVSPIYAIREAENKIFQLQIAKQIGFVIPDSIITNIPKKASDFLISHEAIIKPIKSGLIDEIDIEKVIFTTKVNENIELERVSYCPSYFQKFIDKYSDVRVTIVGDNVFAAKIYSQDYPETKVDWRSAENLKLRYEKFDLPIELAKKCIELTKKLKLNFGAIDFVEDLYGNLIFLEINPNGQWAWIEKQLGYPISNEIANLLDI